jgi:arylformamidase
LIIHDISITTTAKIVTWEGHEAGFEHTWMSQIGPGSVANVSRLMVGGHTGTHLDAPLHFVAGGRTVDELDLNMLAGPAQLIALYDRPQITSADLERAQVHPETRRLLVKTDNTRRGLLQDPAFHRDYVAIAPSGAEWLVANGIVLIGVDYLSVGPYGPDNVETHQIVLGAGMVVVESLSLALVDPGVYFFAALPPKFAEIEGSPCRAILIEGLHEVSEEE